tara:strand:+ start:773 stop:1015 length:243 start_codon:yes stop_codon:yes gene_type:complete
MEYVSRDDLIREFTAYAVDKMDDKTLRDIAQISLLANVNPDSTYEDWEDYVAQMPSMRTVEDLLELIRPSLTMRQPQDEG